MLRKTQLALLFLIPAAMAGTASAAVKLQTVNFDDVKIRYNNVQLADGYAGMTWSNFFVLNSTKRPEYQNGTLSGAQVAYNTGGKTASFSAQSGAFDFYGIYMTSTFLGTDDIIVTALRNGVEAGKQTVSINNSDPQLFQFNFRNVDTIQFTPVKQGDGHQVAFDNLQFATVAPAVPEPETWALMGLGITGLVLGRKKRTGKA